MPTLIVLAFSITEVAKWVTEELNGTWKMAPCESNAGVYVDGKPTALISPANITLDISLEEGIQAFSITASEEVISQLEGI